MKLLWCLMTGWSLCGSPTIFDYEAPADANGDNIYEFFVQVSNGSATIERTFTLEVTNVNESPSALVETSFDVLEGETIIGAVQATDPENDALTYSISAGTDADFFILDAVSGELEFITARDFEAPADANADNVYSLIIHVTDGFFRSRHWCILLSAIAMKRRTFLCRPR